MHGGIISNTKVGKEKAVHMPGIIERTQSEGMGSVLSGVLISTKPSRAKVVDSVQKSSEPRPKTIPRTMGQVPYAGKKY